MSRRSFVSGTACLSALTLAGCQTAQSPVDVSPAPKPAVSPAAVTAYRAMPEERFPVPAVDPSKVPSKYHRQQVVYATDEAVGTIIVDTNTFFLHLVQENGMAMRYGVGLGRAGFEWSGRARVAWKQEWPKWTPPAEMIERQPELEKWSAANGGMPPGPTNPLGARALYIFKGNVDTLYRVHGSPEYWTIGKAVSSGCVRLIQQDIIDLYSRVPGQAPILVI
ncbi:L,D-transpeptidase [Oricola cellulosilytica]|uniref:L,D-transpeptidase n=1 Tax=Oricola cellulosilytica TaxID=1429082 RepID=A0A4V2MNL9_9HYPH|nr:L,D-transpeptidase [Oricola cellulosilytica]TCD13409.1 L,D-transpeptidase [Oricola cellulosilytica]